MPCYSPANTKTGYLYFRAEVYRQNNMEDKEPIIVHVWEKSTNACVHRTGEDKPLDSKRSVLRSKKFTIVVFFYIVSTSERKHFDFARNNIRHVILYHIMIERLMNNEENRKHHRV